MSLKDRSVYFVSYHGSLSILWWLSIFSRLVSDLIYNAAYMIFLTIVSLVGGSSVPLS